MEISESQILSRKASKQPSYKVDREVIQQFGTCTLFTQQILVTDLNYEAELDPKRNYLACQNKYIK